MLRRYLCVGALVCSVLLVAGCARTDVPPVTATFVPTPVTTGLTYVVQRGRVARTLEFTGRISPVEEVPLYFKTSGYVKQVFVRPGDQVEAGDLLAELEAEVGVGSAQSQIGLAELDLAAARARLAQAEQANAHAIARAEMSLELAQEELARLRGLQASYTAEIISARVAVERAEASVEYWAYEYQKSADRPWDRPEIREVYSRTLQQARWDLELALPRYDQAIAAEEVYWHELKMAEISVQQAETELEQLKEDVDPVEAIEVRRAQQVLDWLQESSQIVAPVDGEVISLSLYPGRPVEPFRPVVVIARPLAIEVSAGLSDDQLKDLTEGQKATVTLSIDPHRTWVGTVRRLPYPYGSGGSNNSPAGIDNSARISLEGDIGELKLGDLVRVTIVLEEKDDVLWLSPDAIQVLQDRVFVTVQEGGRQHRIDVELGLEGKDRVEIVRGLREGHVVVAR